MQLFVHSSRVVVLQLSHWVVWQSTWQFVFDVDVQVPSQAVAHFGAHSVIWSSSWQRSSHFRLHVYGQAFAQQSGFLASAHFDLQSDMQSSRQICADVSGEGCAVHCSTQTGLHIWVQVVLAVVEQLFSHMV
jgi:hypothetical protein